MGWRCHAELKESLTARLVVWPQDDSAAASPLRNSRQTLEEGNNLRILENPKSLLVSVPSPSLSLPSLLSSHSVLLPLGFFFLDYLLPFLPSPPALNISALLSFTPSSPFFLIFSSVLLSRSLSCPPPTSPCRHLVAQSQQSLLQERWLLSVLALFILSAGSARPLPPDDSATHTTNVIDRTGQTSFQRPAALIPPVCINLLATPPAARAAVMDQADPFGFSTSIARASFHLHPPPSTSLTLSHPSLAAPILRRRPSCSTISLADFSVSCFFLLHILHFSFSSGVAVLDLIFLSECSAVAVYQQHKRIEVATFDFLPATSSTQIYILMAACSCMVT